MLMQLSNTLSITSELQFPRGSWRVSGTSFAGYCEEPVRQVRSFGLLFGTEGPLTPGHWCAWAGPETRAFPPASCLSKDLTLSSKDVMSVKHQALNR